MTAFCWTRERPTLPGWYWALITTRAEIVRVDRERDDAPLYVRTMFDDERLALTDVLCWQGPIPEPIGGDDE